MDGESTPTSSGLGLEDIEREIERLEEEASQSADPKMSKYQTDKDNLIMRILLLLFRGKEIARHRSKIGHLLSTILIRKDGILSFIQATCDLDSSSEVKTNFDQRFRALSTVITNMPSLCCPLEDYYHSLSLQLFTILTISQRNSINGHLWKLASHIFTSLYTKNRSLGHEKLIQPILNSISGQSQSPLGPHEGLLCVHRLMITHFDPNQFISVFPNIFVIGVILSETLSPLKKMVSEIVIEMVKYVDYSLYLLDNTISNHLLLVHRYKTGLINSDGEEIVTVLIADDYPTSKDQTINLKTTDLIVQNTLSILNELEDEISLRFFLLLLEKVHQQSTNQLLLYSLIDSLQEKVSNLILDYPSLAIQFIVNTLQRVNSVDSKSIESMMKQEDVDVHEETEIEENSKILHNDSLSMVIQIISLLMEVKEKLSTVEIESIKGCKVHLENALTKCNPVDSEKAKIRSLIREINDLHGTSKQSTDDDKVDRKYQEALRCLNSQFMPQRSHGLIVLRNLIDSRYSRTIEDRNQLFTLIKACLCDPDSYVYLASVNALASLSLANTDECLPALVDAYQDKMRSVRERVSVGESLVWVCKYLGQMSHHYHRLVVNCFLNGLRDPDESLRVSSLSNLGQFCSSLKHSLAYCINEIILAIECLLKTDTCYDVKRACLMFVHIMLNGLDSDSIGVILDHLKTIYHLIKSIDSKTLGDDLIRVHSHLALEAIDYHVKTLIKPGDDLIRPIKM